MRLHRERIVLLASFVVLLFCALMTVQQVVKNQSRHAELREAFIFLHSRGHGEEAQRLYTRMLLNLGDEPTRHLIEDLQRTSQLAPTNQSASTNLLVRYHLSLQKELEKRFEQEYLKARKLAADS